MPERNCQTCTALQMKVRGCTQDAQQPLTLEGEKLYRCPRRPLLDKTAYFEAVFAHWRTYMKGHLPDVGPLGNQGHRYVTLMRVVEEAVDHAQAEASRRAQQRAAKR
jgi:hypothetical protein